MNEAKKRTAQAFYRDLHRPGADRYFGAGRYRGPDFLKEAAVIYIVFFVLIAMTALVVAFAAGRAWQRAGELVGRVETLEADVAELKNRRLHPHATRDGLEDALAIAHDVIGEVEEDLTYIGARTNQIADILKTIRADPHGYREKPNRKVVRRIDP